MPPPVKPSFEIPMPREVLSFGAGGPSGWLVQSSSPLTPGKVVTVTRANGTQTPVVVTALFDSQDYGHRYTFRNLTWSEEQRLEAHTARRLAQTKIDGDPQVTYAREVARTREARRAAEARGETLPLPPTPPPREWALPSMRTPRQAQRQLDEERARLVRLASWVGGTRTAREARNEAHNLTRGMRQSQEARDDLQDTFDEINRIETEGNRPIEPHARAAPANRGFTSSRQTPRPATPATPPPVDHVSEVEALLEEKPWVDPEDVTSVRFALLDLYDEPAKR